MRTIALIRISMMAIMLVSYGCEKVGVPEPVSVDKEPVFVADLDIDGSTVSFSAGKENYFMDASFEQDDAGVLVFVGTLRPKDCVARKCPNSLRIVIRDFEKFDPARFNVDASLTRGQVPFFQAYQSDSVRVKFKNSSVSSNAAFKSQWQFGNGEQAEIPNPVAVFSVDETYRVSLQISSQFGCRSEQVQTIDLSGAGGCYSRLALSENGRKVGVRSNGIRPLSYEWSNGMVDSVAAFDAAVSSANKVISVTVTDAEGCQSSSSIDFSRIMRDQDRCIAHFEYERQGNPMVSDRENWGKATIQYVDSNEELFRSNVFRQPADAGFEILSVEDFVDNEKGQRTKKLELAFNCLLWNEDHSKHIRLRGKSVFAVAYPD